MSKSNSVKYSLIFFILVFCLGLSIFLSNSKEMFWTSYLFIMVCAAVPALAFYVASRIRNGGGGKSSRLKNK